MLVVALKFVKIKKSCVFTAGKRCLLLSVSKISTTKIDIFSCQQPPEGPPWRVEFCLVVPKNADLGDYARPGMPGIIFRGKVLILVR